ncbi:MAG: FecR domain-containing protein [Nitrospirota bacterium]
MSNPAVDDIPDSIRQQAADWVVRLDAGEDPSRLRVACAEWRSQDPRHDRVFLQVERLWHAAAPVPAKRGRRVRVGAGLLVLALGCWGATQWLPIAYWSSDQRTATGEVRRVTLEDGSVLTLNTRSAVDIAFDERERVVRLVEGEVLAEVAQEAGGRPFRIIGRDGLAQALGTCYLVRQDDAGTTVTVLESRVAVTARQRPTDPVVVRAGERVRFNAREVEPVSPAPTGVESWTRSRLVFHDAPVADVIAELARYRTGVLRVSGDVSRSLRFTGVLPARDTDAALALIERSLPVTVHRMTSYLVWVDTRRP